MKPTDQPESPRRTPPTATGRQDRHRTRAVEKPILLDETPPVDAPRGLNYYQEGRAASYGLGCMIVMGLGAAVLAAVLLAVALMPADDDFVPAAQGPSPAPQAEQDEAPPEDLPNEED